MNGNNVSQKWYGAHIFVVVVFQLFSIVICCELSPEKKRQYVSENGIAIVTSWFHINSYLYLMVKKCDLKNRMREQRLIWLKVADKERKYSDTATQHRNSEQ